MSGSSQDVEVLAGALTTSEIANSQFWTTLRQRVLVGPVQLLPSTLRTLAGLRLARMPIDFDQGRQLFFITGMYKSGTTWMSLIAHYHPELDCGFKELHPFSAMLPSPGQRPHDGGYQEWESEVHRYSSQNAVLALFGGIFQHCEKAWARRFGAKGPMANIEGLIEAYPEIRIPVIVRDGRDIAVSQAFFEQSYFSTGRAFTEEGDKRRLTDAFVAEVATSYAVYYASIRRLAAAHPSSVAIYSYEDLTVRPEETAAALFRFLDVSDHPAVIEHCMRASDFKAMSGRNKGEEDAGSFFRKGIVGDWQNVFSAEQRRMFDDIAGEVLREFGYPVQ